MLAVIRFCFSYSFRPCFWTQQPGGNKFWDIDDVHTNVTLRTPCRIIRFPSHEQSHADARCREQSELWIHSDMGQSQGWSKGGKLQDDLRN